MEFFNSAIGVLQTLVIALGAGLGIWGVINLLEGYGNDNPGANGAFSWPRSAEEALEISSEQYAMFMQGLEIIPKHPIRPNDNPKRLM